MLRVQLTKSMRQNTKYLKYVFRISVLTTHSSPYTSPTFGLRVFKPSRYGLFWCCDWLLSKFPLLSSADIDVLHINLYLSNFTHYYPNIAGDNIHRLGWSREISENDGIWHDRSSSGLLHVNGKSYNFLHTNEYKYLLCLKFT